MEISTVEEVAVAPPAFATVFQATKSFHITLLVLQRLRPCYLCGLLVAVLLLQVQGIESADPKGHPYQRDADEHPRERQRYTYPKTDDPGQHPRPPTGRYGPSHHYQPNYGGCTYEDYLDGRCTHMGTEPGYYPYGKHNDYRHKPGTAF